MLPIALFLLDYCDGFWFKIEKNTACVKTFDYQSHDKVIDLVSYVLLFIFFQLDYKLLFFACYRMIGVFLFIFTRDSIWLVLFFDLIKEYLLYLFIFGNNYLYFPIMIILKIIFEFYIHKMYNSADYVRQS
jgi:hypothetical protein